VKEANDQDSRGSETKKERRGLDHYYKLIFIEEALTIIEAM